VNHSGTVGAALTAAEFGVPSIAVSTGTDAAQLTSGKARATDEAYAPTARTVTRIARRLRTTSGGRRLLPRGITLNVNYPVVVGPDGGHVDSRVRDVRFTTDWTSAAFGLKYLAQPDGSLKVDLESALAPLQGAPRGTDTFEFAKGHPTVTPIQGGASNPPESVRRSIRKRLAPLLK
jgi:5'-nucleotidase